MRKLGREVAGEFIGTFTLVFFGTGAVATAVLAGAQVGLWQVAVVWGIGVALGIYLASALSDAHLNPAVTIAFAIWRPAHDIGMAAIYIVSQLAGAFCAALTIIALFGRAIARFETISGITRGAPGSEKSAMMFGEYFPNPGLSEPALKVFSDLGLPTAFFAEAVGTAFLIMVIFAVSGGDVPTWMQPLIIGGAIAVIISVVAPLTQAGLNPARDFGPRLVSFFAGWGEIALPGPRNGFWIYILGPVAGGLVGGGIIEFFVRRYAITGAVKE